MIDEDGFDNDITAKVTEEDIVSTHVPWAAMHTHAESLCLAKVRAVPRKRTTLHSMTVLAAAALLRVAPREEAASRDASESDCREALRLHCSTQSV